SLQRIHEIVKHLVLGDSGHVLHRDDVRHRAFGKACELVKQSPLAVLAIQLVALGIGRKGLARCTTSQDRQFSIAEQLFELTDRDFADITLYEASLTIVLFVWKATGRIKVDACDNIQAFHDETVCQTTSAAKQINTCNFCHDAPFLPSTLDG